jgi:hypothetical protein
MWPRAPAHELFPNCRRIMVSSELALIEIKV